MRPDEAKGKWRKSFLFLLLCFLLWQGESVQAAEGRREMLTKEEQIAGEDYQKLFIEELQFDHLDHFLADHPAAGGNLPAFQSVFSLLMEGNFGEIGKQMRSFLRQQLLAEVSTGGHFLAQVMILGLLGAVFSNYASIFSGSQIAETGFYLTYLLMLTFLASSFLSGIEVAGDLLSSVIEFMQALLPSFFLSVSVTGGSITSAAGCSLMLFSIEVAQNLFLRLFLPLIRLYTLLVMAGHLLKEDLFSKGTELLKQGISWGMKTVLGVILGFHLLQGMVAPYADAVKNTPIKRLLQVLPGVGQGAAAVSQMLLGSGVLIKNSIGAGAAIVLFLLAAVPLLKLLFLCVLYQGAAALLQPVCDKRLISCISAVGEGCRLLFSAAAFTVLFFLLSIAIVCMASNTLYFSG